MRAVGVVISGLRKRPLRTGLMILSLAVTTAVISVTGAAFIRFAHIKHSDPLLARVIIQSPTLAKLPVAYAERIRHLPGVEWTWVLDTFRGDDGRDLKFLVWAGTDTLFQKLPAAMLDAP